MPPVAAPLAVARSEARRRGRPLVALALLVALGAGATLAALGAAVRTRDAFPEYLDRADVADLLVNPSLLTTDIDAALRSLPHVRGVSSATLLFAGVDEDGIARRPSELTEDTEEQFEIHGSTDGRFVDSDRPALASGRLPTGTNEVVVAAAYRDELDALLGRHVGIGDEIQLSFWAPLLVDPVFDPPDVPVEPLGVERVRISGFATLPDDVLPDDLFPNRRMVVSADVAARYDCLQELPDSNDYDVLLAALVPEDCAAQYRFYALDVDEPRNVATVQREILRRAEALNVDLPRALTEDDSSYFPIITTRADARARVEHAIGPGVVALIMFGLLAGTATVIVCALLAVRMIGQSRETLTLLRALGMSRAQRVLAVTTPIAAASVVGLAAAVVLAYALSPVAPFGVVRAVDPNPSLSLSAVVVLPVVVTIGVLLVAAVVVAAFVAAGPRARAGRSRETVPRLVRAVERTAAPPLTEGVRSVVGDRRGGAVLIGSSCVAIAALVAATVFSTSLTGLVGSSARYGWPWDIAVLTGFGYGDTDTSAVEATLGGRGDVASWSLAALGRNAVVAEASVPIVFSEEGPHALALPVVTGRTPERAGELALGAATADALQLEIGDEVSVDSSVGPIRARLVGTVVLPSVGQYLSDRTGLGSGAYLLLPAGSIPDGFFTFVGVRLTQGTDVRRTFAAIRPDFRGWDLTAPPFVYAEPVRPPEIVNAESMRTGPISFAGLLSLALVVALALSITLSVNARRRELAILRAIGFTSGQLRATIRWQAAMIIGAGLVVGIPAGIILGGQGWQVFADEIGVRPVAEIPVVVLSVIAVAVLIAALVAAALPARMAARIRAAEALRDP